MSEVMNTCPKCDSKGYLNIEHRGTHVALVCENCRSWIKWIGKKELPMYEKSLRNAKSRGINDDKVVKFEHNMKKAITELGLSKDEVMRIVDKIYN